MENSFFDVTNRLKVTKLLRKIAIKKLTRISIVTALSGTYGVWLKKTPKYVSYVNPLNFSGPSCEQEQFWVRWIVEFLIEGYKISPIFIKKMNVLKAFFVLWKLTYVAWGLQKLGIIKENKVPLNSNIFRNNKSNSFFML